MPTTTTQKKLTQIVKLLSELNSDLPCKSGYGRTRQGKHTCTKLKKCPSGQYRNAITKRCRKAPACRSGSVRNSGTGYCNKNSKGRTKISSAYDMVVRVNSRSPCKKETEYRNPKTKKCTTIKSCPKGKSRFLATGKCRTRSTCPSSKKFDKISFLCQ